MILTISTMPMTHVNKRLKQSTLHTDKTDNMKEEKKNIVGLTIEDLREFCARNNFPEFHGNQVFKWVYEKGESNFDSMTDLPERLRHILKKHFTVTYLKVKKKKTSEKSMKGKNSLPASDRKRSERTVKYDFILKDRKEIESVFLQDASKRVTFCISSQVGCPVGCIYCATGKMGLRRNLTAEEIVNQVLTLAKLESRPKNIVFMGMGEPLLNFDNLVKSIKILNQMNIGHRRITVSTCGIVKGIYSLADSGLDTKLAVSLGSGIEKKRKLLIPYSKTHSIEELLRALKYYREKTKRRVTVEYTLIKNLNDTLDDARALVDFAKKIKAHVNIIRYNPIPDSKLIKPDSKTVKDFKNFLIKNRITVTERFRRGNEIKAACGQLITES